MKSDCLEREKIFALAQHMLSGREREQASAHLGTCDHCRSIFQGYQRIDSVLDEWSPAAETSPWFEARLRAAIEAKAARPDRSFWSLDWSRWMAAPALASLLLVASLVAIRYGWIANQPPPRVASKSPVVAMKPASKPVNPSQVTSQESNQELKMYQNLPVLEDYDMLADFDVISELPKGHNKIAD